MCWFLFYKWVGVAGSDAMQGTHWKNACFLLVVCRSVSDINSLEREIFVKSSANLFFTHLFQKVYFFVRISNKNKKMDLLRERNNSIFFLSRMNLRFFDPTRQTNGIRWRFFLKKCNIKMTIKLHQCYFCSITTHVIKQKMWFWIVSFGSFDEMESCCREMLNSRTSRSDLTS